MVPAVRGLRQLRPVRTHRAGRRASRVLLGASGHRPLPRPVGAEGRRGRVSDRNTGTRLVALALTLAIGAVAPACTSNKPRSPAANAKRPTTTANAATTTG